MASISAALYQLLGSELSVEEALSRNMTDSYRQSTNGEWIDRAAFAAQLEATRGFVAGVEIEVVAELSQGSAYAERHIIAVTQPSGAVARQEVYLFGEIAPDGRFAWLEELTRPLPEG